MGGLFSLARLGLTKGFKRFSNFFKRKPSKTSKPKSDIRKNNQRKVKEWSERVLRWFESNTKNKQNNTKIIQINEQNPTKKTKTNKLQEFIPERFFYKNKRFSDDKVLNDVLNDLNKKNKLRQHKINELERKIDFTFNQYLTKDIQKVKQEFKYNLVKNDLKISKFPEPEPLENDSIDFNFYGDSNKKPNKSLKRRLKEFRVKLRNKLKSVKSKFNTFKDKI